MVKYNPIDMKYLSYNWHTSHFFFFPFLSNDNSMHLESHALEIYYLWLESAGRTMSDILQDNMGANNFGVRRLEKWKSLRYISPIAARERTSSVMV